MIDAAAVLDSYSRVSFSNLLSPYIVEACSPDYLSKSSLPTLDISGVYNGGGGDTVGDMD